MALPKLFQRIFWHNNTTPAINEDNLNAMSKAIDDLDNRVIALGDDVMTVVPQIAAYLEQAEDLVEAMEMLSQNPPYIGQNGNWWVWDTNTSAFVDSGVDASISVDIADITMLAPNAEPYVTNSGTDTDPIFHLFIPRGQTGNGISTIAKTGTSGLVDTYTITMTNGTTSTFTVTNGAGDMNKSVYDPTNAIANAGGMKSAAAKNSTNAVTENSTDLVESGAVYTADKGIYEVMGQNGAKNKLVNNLVNETVKGATLTVNEDKSFSFVGTTTSSGSLDICGENNGTKDCLNLPTGEYILASDSTGLDINTFIQVLGKDGNGNVTVNAIVNSNGVKFTPFTVNDGDYVYWCRLAFPSGTVNASAKAMICPKSWYDVDPTYQPYAETNQQLTSKTDALVNNVNQNGCKNILDVGARYRTGTMDSKVTIVDDVITVNGTQSSSAHFRLCPAENDNSYVLPAGTYIIVGESSDTNLTMSIRKNGDYLYNSLDPSTPREFTANGTDYFQVLMHLNAVAYSNATMKLMICLKSDYEISPEWEPHTKTNRQLTQEVDSLNKNLNNGAVNLAIPTRAAGSVSSNGVTFSLDGLGRATANNTATANVRLDIAEVTLKAGMTYAICEPSSLQSKRVRNVDLCVYARNKSSGTWRLQNNGPRPYYTPSEDEVVSIGIAISSGTQLTDEQFAPMLVLYGVEVGNNFYYGAMTNRELTEDINKKLSVVKENTPNWHHTANITCDVNSGGLAYLFTNVGILLLATSSSSISVRTGLALQSDINTYFKTSINGLTAEITAWGENTFETSKNCIWSLVPISGTWTMTF